MMITTKGRNALKVMIDLAQHAGEGNVSLTDIAERQHESVKYLEAVMGPLSAAGLVLSARGKSGGYRLARSAEGSLAPVSCLDSDTPCENAANCLSLPLWRELDEVIMNFLNSKKLSDMLK